MYPYLGKAWVHDIHTFTFCMYKIYNRVLCVTLLSIFFGVFSCKNSNYERNKLTFISPIIQVQDSLILLQKIVKRIDSTKFITCYVSSIDSSLHINEQVFGNINTIGFHDTLVVNNKKIAAHELIPLLKFLRKNFIYGLQNDTSIGFWTFFYKESIYEQDILGLRRICIWNSPSDTLNERFNKYFRKFDRKEHLMLIGYENIK